MQNTTKYEIKIEGMHCSACKELITEELTDQGLEKVEVDIDKGVAILNGPTSLEEINYVIDKAFKNLEHYKVKSINLFYEMKPAKE